MFRVFIAGTNVVMESNWQPQRYGFEVARFVEARDPGEASRRAIDLVRRDRELSRAVSNPAADPPAYRVAAVEPITPDTNVPERLPSFTFYVETSLDDETRKQWRAAAAAARAYRAGTMSWHAFIEQFGDHPADDDLAELIDMIVHEPARGGKLGLSERDYRTYVDSVEAAIRRLEARAGA